MTSPDPADVATKQDLALLEQCLRNDVQHVLNTMTSRLVVLAGIDLAALRSPMIGTLH